MIRISYSDKPFHELNLEGSNLELSQLQSDIDRFCGAAEPSIEFAADSDFDPHPYTHRLSRLRLSKSIDKLLVAVQHDCLMISGRPDLLELFATNLPYDAQHTSTVPYHVHFQHLGCEDYISEQSLDIILSLAKQLLT
ncbi:MAG: hypothetical protein JWP89_2458 [Schlesneria sp.]|nr:hypothetical protein [Schlesneria sp.]